MKQITEINTEQFNDIKKSKYLLLDFYSDECPNCDKLKPILEELNEYFDDSILFAKIFRQKNRSFAESFEVRSSPTVLFFVDGELKFRMSGDIPKSELKDNILRYVPNDIKVKETSATKSDVYDLIIIGGGPAGLTAAVYSARYKLNQMIITREVGGLAATAHKICNFPSYEAISGFELMQKMHAQVEALEVPITYTGVESITKIDNYFEVLTDNGNVLTARKIICAGGTEHNKLNVKGEQEFLGLGVSYCATCDGAFYKNKTVAVIGGSDAALTAALLLAEFANKVYIIYRKEKFFRAEPAWVEQVEKNTKIEPIFSEEVTEILGEKSVHSVKLKSGKEIKLDGVFIEIGSTPKTELLKKLGLQYEHGYIIIDSKQETTVNGFYAAGDITNTELKQIVTAASQGAIAAYNVYTALKKE